MRRLSARHLPFALVIALLLVLATHVAARAQSKANTLTGSVTSADGPVAFAQVGILGQQRGTLTNEEGRFVLGVDAWPATLIVRSLGYRSDTLRLAAPPSSPLLVQLAPSDIQLAEVVINERSYGLLLARKALNRMQKAAKAGRQDATVFYRMFGHSDSVCVEAHELFAQSRRKADVLAPLEAITGRYGSLTEEESGQPALRLEQFFQLGNMPYVYLKKDAAFCIPLSPNGLKQFNFSYEGRVQQDGLALGKVTFERAAGVRGPGYSKGVLYIDEATGNLHRVEANLHDMVSMLFRIRRETVWLHIDYSFRPEGEFTALDNIQARFQGQYEAKGRIGLVDVQSVFLVLPGLPEPLEAKARERRKLMAKLNNQRPTPEERLLTDDQRLIRMAGYDQAFWLHAGQTIAPTPTQARLLADFERRGKFAQ